MFVKKLAPVVGRLSREWGDEGDEGVGKQGRRGEVAVSFSPLPNAPYFGFAQYKCPMPNAQL